MRTRKEERRGKRKERTNKEGKTIILFIKQVHERQVSQLAQTVRQPMNTGRWGRK